MEPGTQRKRILVVDDDQAVVDYLVEMLEKRGYVTHGTTSPREVLRLIPLASFDMVIADVEMPELRGLDLLKAIHAEKPHVLVLLITAFGSIDMAVEAVRAGACDFIAKPFKIAALYHAIERAFDERQLRRELVRLRKSLPGAAPGEVVARSPAMQTVLELARRAASTDSTVLITGESGTGKRYLARFIHTRSARHEKPFVQVGCGTLSASLLDGELFGAPNGSTRGESGGRFAEADGGTMLLDEVGELPSEVQAKLLRFLETRLLPSTGDGDDGTSDVRLIAASQRPLEEALRSGRFRPDLYYRLNVVRIEIPPLRDRPEDIESLVDVYLQRACEKLDRPVLRVSPEALRWLTSYHWPGNVGELCKLVGRAVALSDQDTLNLEDLTHATAATVEHDFLRDALLRGMTLDELERAYIRKALEVTGGNKVEAARMLGINRRTIYRRAGLEEPDTLE